jgi:hypothetical protein
LECGDKSSMRTITKKNESRLEWLDERGHGPARDQNLILKEANRIARGANCRATIALVISIISALIAVAAIVLPYFKAPPH